MTRPVFVIGIGGTGQWVLTWLKRDLLEVFNSIPPEVQLLAFDTTTTVEASASQARQDEKEQKARIGDVVLEPQKEFIHLGGDAYDLALDVRNGLRPHISQWFDAKFWLEKLNPSAFVLEEGAGRIRPLGRLALFKDMILNGGRNILNPLRTKLLAVRDAIKHEEGQKLTMVVTASFAGGTGSGLFLDIALLLHLLAQQHHLDYTMVGFFVLPWAFTPHPNNEMLARSFAAWRELNRFMVIREDFTLPTVVYDPEDPERQLIPKRRLFDFVYLVDGRFRDGGTTGEEVQYGVHPAISAAIYTLFIDEQASTLYNERVLTNLHPIFARNPGNPLYSTVGLKSVKIPVHYQQEQARLLLTQMTLERLLTPVQRVSLFDVLIEDQDWLQNIAAVDRNPEDPGVRGRERATSVFSQSVQYGELIGKPTRFLARLGQLLEQARENRQGVIETLARSGLGRRGGWVDFFPDLGDDPRYQKLRDLVTEQVRFNVRTAYARRKGEKGNMVRRRLLRDLPEEVRRRFGIITFEGEREAEYQGEFGEVLHQIRTAQADIFRHLIRLHLLRMLNGTDPDPFKARAGKLGYAWDFMSGVVDALDRLIALMDEVWEYREKKVRPEVRLAERLGRAERKLRDTTNKGLCYLIRFIEHPDVKRAEDLYLRAWQERIDARREDLMHRAVRATLVDMRHIAITARDRLRHWILHLSAGDPAAGVYGLWRQIEERKRLLDEVRNYDQRLRRIQILLEDEEAFRRLQEAETVLQDILGRWRWEVTEDLKIRQVFSPRLEHEAPVTLENPFLEGEAKWREETSRNNFRRLSSLMEPYVPQVLERRLVADHIKKTFGRDARAVQEFIRTYTLDKLPVLARVEGKPPKEATLLAVQTSSNDTFFYGEQGLEGEIRALNNLARERIDDNHPIFTVGLENPYKFIALHTEEVHPLPHFRAWVECKEAYIEHIRNEYHELNPIHLHIFGAEAQAAAIERRLYVEKGYTYKALSPRVVLLLENRDRLWLFFWMWALNKVTETPPEELPYRWELEVEGVQPRVWLTPGWDPHHAQKKQRRPTLIEAIHGFVIHGETFEPGRSWRIQYERLRTWLRDWQRGQGTARVVTFLQQQMDEQKDDSLAGRLKALINRAEDEVQQDEYESLLHVMQALFEEDLRWWQEAGR